MRKFVTVGDDTSGPKSVSAFCRITTGLLFTWKQSSIRATNINEIIQKGLACGQDTTWKFLNTTSRVRI